MATHKGSFPGKGSNSKAGGSQGTAKQRADAKVNDVKKGANKNKLGSGGKPSK